MATLEDLQRAYVEAQARKDGAQLRGDKSRHAVQPVEPTLGDRVPADRHELRPSCGPFGTRCGFNHGKVELCPTCREAVLTWCACS